MTLVLLIAIGALIAYWVLHHNRHYPIGGEGLSADESNAVAAPHEHRHYHKRHDDEDQT